MKIKVGVFFGGESVEHEISVISAIQACHAFDREIYDILPVYITKDNRYFIGEQIGEMDSYKDIAGLLSKSQQVILVPENGKLNLVAYPMKRFGKSVMAEIDVAFPIVHGTNVEDGTLQGYFRALRIPYVGCDVLSSAVGMDKYVMKAVLKENGLPVLDCLRIDRKRYQQSPDIFISKAANAVGFPMIVKPINLGSSVGIKKAYNRDSLREAMEYAFQFAGLVLVEPVVPNLKEINCSVVGDLDLAEASECEEPVGSDEILSYDDKYRGGGKSSGSKGMASTQRKIPADITATEREEVRTLAVKTFQALGCNGVSRIDFMMDSETRKIWVNEINTIPGSLSFYLWEPAGVPYAQLLDKMIKLALKRERDQKEINYSFDTNILAGVKLGGTKAGSKL